MPQFRKKPVVIEAIKWADDIDGYKTMRSFVRIIDKVRETPGETYLLIDTLEGDMKCQVGDYLIRGVKGELYPCKPDIFEATYEPVLQPQIKNQTKELRKINLIDDQVKFMVDRFLQWKLPEAFHPDCGIHFDANAAKKLNPINAKYEPVGTNLFDIGQAEAMVRFMLNI